ncbi:hypothetical protein E3N88_41710 [Mikania micrantha]|uniref:Uncharacterized protein n=1 Tax=Mikania micrantha TaxID=192012 RepID=A0A5N6LJY0_9ASTR|nr:hypothetical protein E3N88_41710 [Mikania micrantha]
MEEFPSIWSYQQNTDELKQKLLYTTLELEAVKAETDEELKRNHELMIQLLQSLKIACQERDEAKDQLQKLLNKIMTSNDQQIFKITNPLSPKMMPVKANSSASESNSLSEAYNHSPSPVDSLYDPNSSPKFSNINDGPPFVQDYNQNGRFSNTCGSVNVQKVDQATLVMEGMIKGKTLPQKGSLLQAVIQAGPLLQTLLLAGPIPRWRNPPSLKSFYIPSVVDVGNENRLSKSRLGMLKQSQPYAKMACGSSSQMMAGGGNRCVISFGDVNFSGNFLGRMVAACPGATNLGTVVKKQRLH